MGNSATTAFSMMLREMRQLAGRRVGLKEGGVEARIRGGRLQCFFYQSGVR